MSKHFLRWGCTLLALCAPLAFAADKGLVGVTLSDAEIVQVLHVANMGEIKAAEAAKTKAKSSQVKQFAEEMIKDHTAMDHKVKQLEQKLGLKPADSMLGDGLKAKANTEIAGLKATSGEVFDKGYVASQVSMHGDVQEAIRDSLMPSVKNADLKALLQDAKSKIDMHLQQAQQLQEAE